MPNSTDSSADSTRTARGVRPADAQRAAPPAAAPARPETGGPAGPDPTRYGDWERAGRCIDF